MRSIGEIDNESYARTFSDYLYVQGIQNQIEAENNGKWAIWILAEDEIEPAKNFLALFLTNPKDPGFEKAAEQAREKKIHDEEEEEASIKDYSRRHHHITARVPYTTTIVTFLLIGLSIFVYILQELAEDSQAARLLPYLFLNHRVNDGQLWRLVTPIFLHFGILHIFFNMLWLKDLGSMIEGREGGRKLGFLVLLIAVLSNYAQYLHVGPNFGGMSGVVFGLFGYVWIRGKFDPASGYFLHPSTVTMLLVWFMICFTGILPVQIANTVHTVGLAAGMAWGFLSARPSRRS